MKLHTDPTEQSHGRALIMPEPLKRLVPAMALWMAVGVVGVELAGCSSSADDAKRGSAAPTRVAEPRQSIPVEPTVPAQNASIWAGYIAPQENSKRYTSVHGEFTVATVTCDPDDPNVNGESYGQWVGLDGWGDSTVEQIGVTADCLTMNLKGGGKSAPQGAEIKPTYYAWWMDFGGGSYSRTLKLPIKPGDRIDASVKYVGSDTFAMRLEDETTGDVYTHSSTCRVENVGGPCQRLVAEWIVERPGNSALASFGTAGFDEATAATDGADKNQRTITQLSGFAVDMFQASKDLTHTSGVSANGKSFNVWFLQHGVPGQQ